MTRVTRVTWVITVTRVTGVTWVTLKMDMLDRKALHIERTEKFVFLSLIRK